MRESNFKSATAQTKIDIRSPLKLKKVVCLCYGAPAKQESRAAGSTQIDYMSVYNDSTISEENAFI